MKFTRKEFFGLIAVFILIIVLAAGALTTYVDNQKEDLLARVDQLTVKISQLEGVISDAEESLQAAEEVITSQNDEIDALREELGDFSDRIDRLNGDDIPAPKSKIVYLTFDDGPSQITYQILDILAEYKIKATFFVNGHKDPASLELYQAIYAAGHVIGNHTYSHMYEKIYASADAFMKDIYRLDELLYQATGVYPTLVRYPGGSSTSYLPTGIRNAITKRLYTEGYQYFDWNVDSMDSRSIRQSPTQIIQNVVNTTLKKDTAIVLLHDRISQTNTALALPAIIDQLTEAGYTFESLGLDTVTYQHRTLTN